MSAAGALIAIPLGLRQPLLDEYQSIAQNYSEHRWTPSELSGGKFCEIVYTILDGHAKGAYAGSPHKPADFRRCVQIVGKERSRLPQLPNFDPAPPTRSVRGAKQSWCWSRRWRR
jgi:hypothetical protein